MGQWDDDKSGQSVNMIWMWAVTLSMQYMDVGKDRKWSREFGGLIDYAGASV